MTSRLRFSLSVLEAREKRIAELERQLAEARSALMRADARLREHADTTTHPVRCAIYDALRRTALAQTGDEP